MNLLYKLLSSLYLLPDINYKIINEETKEETQNLTKEETKEETKDETKEETTDEIINTDNNLLLNLSKINQIPDLINNYNIKDNFGVWNDIPEELYIIGDIHGDFFALKQALELTSCIIFNDSNNLDMITMSNSELILEDGCNFFINKFEWNKNKKNCMIVFSGDLIDRCRNINHITGCINTPHDEDCDFLILKFLFDLDIIARQYNSRVIIILGNHEIMNLKNDTNYISKKGKNNINRLDNIKHIIKTNIDNIYGLVRINKYIIVHGGINYLYFMRKNKEWELELDNNNLESVVMFNKILRNNIIEDNIILDDSDDNPFWDRTLGKGNCSYLFNENILKIPDNSILNNLEIIVAHCPQFIDNEDNINYINCSNKKIWRIDVGMSRSFDTYNFNKLYNNLTKLYSNIDTINPLDFYENHKFNYRKVSILKIKNNNENSIIGDLSLSYFFKTVFKDNKYLLFYYLLQDIEIYLHDINLYDNINKYTELINKIKKKIYFRL